jgi:hypothetical protein
VLRLAILWAAEAFWAVGLFLPWVAAMRGVICGLWVCLFTFIILGKG